jgi:hypothetical protein
MDATCKTCPFFYEIASGSGECRRSPPKRDDMDAPDFAPTADSHWCGEHPLRQRDRLAAMAMQGIMSSLPTGYENATLPYGDSACAFASQAYEIADAMIEASSKGKD